MAKKPKRQALAQGISQGIEWISFSLLLLSSCELQGINKAPQAVAAGSSTSAAALGGGIGVFKSSVYNLTTAKCAGCHKSDQAPLIADDDVNAAYAAAKSEVNWTDLSSSKLLAKIDDGHCGPYCSGPYTAAMANYMSTWAMAEGYSGSMNSPNPGSSGSPTPSPSAGASGISVFQTTVYPIVLANCSGCHNGSQTPNFAVTSVSNSYLAAKSVVNFAIPPSSKLYTQDMNGHCGQAVCMTNGTAMLNAIQAWARAEGF